MSFSKRFSDFFETYVPTPFSIAIGLTLVAFLLTLGATHTPAKELTQIWADSLWSKGLLVFAFQMMFMLVLGHALALSKPFDWMMNWILPHCNSSARAAAIVTFLTVLVGFFNWGFALIFGAIMARKVAGYAKANAIDLNYPLIGAAGYSGLMVWHGGFSGSALIKVNEPGHLSSLVGDNIDFDLPSRISFDETVFSGLNISVSIALLILLPLLMYVVGRRSKKVSDLSFLIQEKEERQTSGTLADRSMWVGTIVGLMILTIAMIRLAAASDWLMFFVPNNINLILLGAAMLFHRSILSFLSSIGRAIGGAAGILVQFPFYFGIIGLLSGSGLMSDFASWIAEVASAESLPIFTFFSAAVINVFVPSGGGQWAIQGPVIIEASHDLGIPMAKNILAMAYGDQLTNMLQPFWALPLLGLTGLKAKQILPYTLLLLMLGAAIFIISLLLF